MVCFVAYKVDPVPAADEDGPAGARDDTRVKGKDEPLAEAQNPPSGTEGLVEPSLLPSAENQPQSDVPKPATRSSTCGQRPSLGTRSERTSYGFLRALACSLARSRPRPRCSTYVVAGWRSRCMSVEEARDDARLLVKKRVSPTFKMPRNPTTRDEVMRLDVVRVIQQDQARQRRPVAARHLQHGGAICQR